MQRPALPLQEAGIGLRAPHYEDILELHSAIGWIEVHPENYFGGGIHRHYLSKARELYPLSFHAVGLSLGSDQPVNDAHLQQIKDLINIYEPFQVSDHASWSASGNAHLNDLLPLPYTKKTLDRLCTNVDHVQTVLGRRILVENPSTYVSFAIDEMSEPEFMNELARRTGCGILLDVNNIYVQSRNHNFDPYDYINTIEADHVSELHLAGHIEKQCGDTTMLIDTHNHYICTDVWALYEHTINRMSTIPTLIEWDSDLPAFKDLAGEARKAQIIMDRHTERLLNAAE